jgi:bifunctional enzyme CysN/CysC
MPRSPACARPLSRSVSTEVSAASARGATIWLTGLPAAGKTTIGSAVSARLAEAGYASYRLDGDALRRTLSADLGFDAASRHENVRRIAHVAWLLADAGLLVVASLISPYRTGRQAARDLHEAGGLPFLEVYVDTPLSVCERRDPDRLYARARRGELSGVTGVDDPYEPPETPDVTLHPSVQPVDAASDEVVVALQRFDLSRALRVR